ncbi:hypothetical protein IJV79_04855, partial [bacterium]|nr:hypothetical protein [bacterium]
MASSYTPISQEKEEKRQTKFGVAIAASTIGVGLGVLALGKGFSKSGRVKIDELYNALKLKSKKLSKTKPSTNSDKFTKVAVEKGKSVLESSRAVMNTISLKDILFKKITNPIPGVGKACQAITDFFENVAVQTTLASYKKTGKKFDKMFSAFNKANQSLDAKDVKKVSSSVETIKKTFNKTFSTGESLKRIQDSADTFKTLDNDFWNKSFKDVKNMAKDKDLYSSFISEQMV